jgi:hypothetical protein
MPARAGGWAAEKSRAARGGENLLDYAGLSGYDGRSGVRVLDMRSILGRQHGRWSAIAMAMIADFPDTYFAGQARERLDELHGAIGREILDL